MPVDSSVLENSEDIALDQIYLLRLKMCRWDKAVLSGKLILLGRSSLVGKALKHGLDPHCSKNRASKGRIDPVT
jgi:hypothetical protein